MISFSKLGSYGRLGNQLFQYAFLRTTAQRLGTQFFCPKWDGDSIFALGDEHERVDRSSGIVHYFDPTPQAGFAPEALSIRDNTEIQGYFQSEKYYPDKQLVRKWYTFRDEIVDAVTKRYRDVPLQECVSFSLRIDDDYANAGFRRGYPLYPLSYYKKALRVLNDQGPILVFADRPDRAREFFQPLKNRELIFVDDLNGPQQLYLMTQCRANVITNSTFAWWGGWLNRHPKKTVVAPTVWCRSGMSINKDTLCDDWVKVPGTIPIWDHLVMWKIRYPFSTPKGMLFLSTARGLWVRISGNRGG